MNEEALKQLLQSGFEKIRPKVADMTTLLMDVYQEGFNNCWELLTGQSFLPKK